jgi:hypothetical protein
LELLRLVDHRGFLLAAFGLVSGACFRRYFGYEVKTSGSSLLLVLAPTFGARSANLFYFGGIALSEAEPLDKPWLLPFTDVAAGEPSWPVLRI